MPLITAHIPATWQELEDLVTAILNECGMQAERGLTLKIPRGTIDVDVVAQETIDSIDLRILCECKHWSHAIPKEIVNAFRTVMQETGAHRGYIISKVGFQSGAIEAANFTNIELVTFAEFQERHFDKWMKTQLWVMERAVGSFNTYYEPFGPPGYSKLDNDEERAAYDAVFDRYAFAGMMLPPFSPFLQQFAPYPVPQLPFDTTEMEKRGIVVPADIKEMAGYREFFQRLMACALEGLAALRQVNPITRGKAAETVERDD